MIYKFFYPLTLLVAGFFFVGNFCTQLTDGFFPYKIPSSLPFHKEWEVSSLKKENQHLFENIFSQSFHYLSKGDQCFVFESQDSQYVLKFPYHSSLLAPFWLRPFPFFAEQYREYQMQKRQKRLHRDAMSYVLAFKELKEETALIALHLNRTQMLQQTVILTDKIGVQHRVALDEVEFILQRKAKLLYPALNDWIAHGQIASAERALSDLVHLLLIRHASEIQDLEQHIETNFGFLGEKAVQIDIGRLRKCQKKANPTVRSVREEIEQCLYTLKQFLNDHHPELAHYLEFKLNSDKK